MIAENATSSSAAADVVVPAVTITQRRGKLLGSVISMLGSDMLAKLLLLVFFLVVAKLVSADEMGIYSYCTAVSTFFALAISFGLRQILVREIAMDRSTCRAFAETVMWQRSVMMSVGLLFMYFLSQIVPSFRPYMLEIMIASGSICMLLLTDIGSGICEGLEHMHWVPAIHAVDGGTRLVSLIFLFMLPKQAWAVLTLVLVAQTLTAVVSLAYASRLIGGFPWPRRHAGLLGYALKQGTPLVFLGMAQRTYARFDWLFFGMLKDVVSLGPYAVGYRIFEGLNLLGPGILRGTFPRLSQSATLGGEVFIARVRFLIKVMFLANCLVASCALLHVGNVLTLLYQDKYLAAVGPAMMLVCSIPLIGIEGALYHAFLSQKMQKTLLANGIILASLNVAINLYAIPRWGTMGAAFASSFPQLVGVVTAWTFFRLRVGPLRVEWSYLLCLLPAIPTLLVGRVLLQLAPAWWIPIGVIQVVTFVSVALLFSPFTADERQQVWKILKRKT